MSFFASRPNKPGIRYVGSGLRLLMGASFVALAVLVVAALIGTWPAVADVTEGAATSGSGGGPAKSSIPLVFGLWSPKVSSETAFLVLVIEASLLGSLMHVCNSFATHSARRDLTVA